MSVKKTGIRKAMKRQAMRAKKNAKRQAALQKRAVEKRKFETNPISPDFGTAALTVAAIGLGGYTMNHFVKKRFLRDGIKEKVVDLVIDHGIKDVEAALARIKARIEAI